MKRAPQATRYLRLPFDFDVAALQADLRALHNATWRDHYNEQAHLERWACLPLKSIDGRSDHILALESGNFIDTPLLGLCPYFQQVINSFACQSTSIRLMSMAPGGRILAHTDDGGSFDDGMARLHIPIVTDPRVLFHIDGETVHFSAGHTWYMNANCVHAVDNDSELERIHLVIDCVPNDWLRGAFEQAGWLPNAPRKYSDPSIHDGNVDQIIAQLRSSGNSRALQVAEKLILERDTVA